MTANVGWGATGAFDRRVGGVTARTGDVPAAPLMLEWWNNARASWQAVEPCDNESQAQGRALMWAGGNRSRNYRAINAGGAVVWRGRNQFGQYR